MVLTEGIRRALQDGAVSLKGYARRLFMARTVRDFGPGGQRFAERELGWNRRTIRLGEHELRTGVQCVAAFNARGRKPIDARLPNLQPLKADCLRPTALRCGMAFEVVAELFVWAAGSAVQTGWTWFRRRTASEILERLDEGGRAAFLELLMCAALDDGELSDSEMAMLVRRADDAGKKVVEAALDVAHDARPFADNEEYEVFLAERAKRIPDQRTRNWAFAACMAILAKAKAKDISVKATMYGRALRVPESERTRIQLGAAAGVGQSD
jgi:hypothetical protein